MYARAVFSQVDPSNWDEIVPINDAIAAVARKQNGFKGYLSMGDRRSGKGITITLWETEADREASGEASEYLKAQMAKVAPFFTAAPVIENYEVLISE